MRNTFRLVWCLLALAFAAASQTETLEPVLAALSALGLNAAALEPAAEIRGR